MNIIIFSLQIILQLYALRLFSRWGQLALGAFVIMEAILANLFVLKQIVLFGLSVTASDSFIIGSLLGLAFYQERYGKEASKKLGLLTFATMIFVTCTSWLHLKFTPHYIDRAHPHYEAILGATPRIVFSSLFAYFVSSRTDVMFFAFLKRTLPTFSFQKRALLSTLVTQALDTFIFSTLALYGVVQSLTHIIIFSFIIKVICLLSYLLVQPLIVKPNPTP